MPTWRRSRHLSTICRVWLAERPLFLQPPPSLANTVAYPTRLVKSSGLPAPQAFHPTSLAFIGCLHRLYRCVDPLLAFKGDTCGAFSRMHVCTLSLMLLLYFLCAPHFFVLFPQFYAGLSISSFFSRNFMRVPHFSRDLFAYLIYFSYLCTKFQNDGRILALAGIWTSMARYRHLSHDARHPEPRSALRRPRHPR